MSLNLVKADHFKRDVTLTAPTGEEYVVKGVKFKYLTEQDWTELMQEHGDQAVQEVVLGWDEFNDADDEAIKFSKKTLAELLAFKWAEMAFNTVYMGALMGLDSGNFAKSLRLGQLANRSGQKVAGKKRDKGSKN